MNIFRQHIPAFCDIGDTFEFEFNTLEQLLSNEWINGWTKHPFDFEEPKEPNTYFYKFSLSDNRLIAEFKNGTEWYVIGYIKYPEKLDLPKWVPNYKDRKNNQYQGNK